MLKPDRRVVDDVANTRLVFPSPAPQGSFLRFAAVGNKIEVSYDDGRTWQAASVQKRTKTEEALHYSYWTPVPAGTQVVHIRGQGGWWGGWQARDISIWSAGALVAGPASAPTPAPTSTPVAKPTPPPTPTVEPAAVPPTPVLAGTTTGQTVTFDDRAGQQQPLDGQYPSSVVDWGSGQWFHSEPWGKFTTKSASFREGRKTATIGFTSPRRLVSLQAYNGGSSASTVRLSCSGKATKTVTVAPKQLVTISTGWSGTCSTVTVYSSNGWDTNFDNLVIR